MTTRRSFITTAAAALLSGCAATSTDTGAEQTTTTETQGNLYLGDSELERQHSRVGVSFTVYNDKHFNDVAYLRVKLYDDEGDVLFSKDLCIGIAGTDSVSASAFWECGTERVDEVHSYDVEIIKPGDSGCKSS